MSSMQVIILTQSLFFSFFCIFLLWKNRCKVYSFFLMSLFIKHTNIKGRQDRKYEMIMMEEGKVALGLWSIRKRSLIKIMHRVCTQGKDVLSKLFSCLKKKTDEFLDACTEYQKVAMAACLGKTPQVGWKRTCARCTYAYILKNRSSSIK